MLLSPTSGPSNPSKVPLMKGLYLCTVSSGRRGAQRGRASVDTASLSVSKAVHLPTTQIHKPGFPQKAVEPYGNFVSVPST